MCDGCLDGKLVTYMAKMLMIVPNGKTDMGQRAESREQRAQSREQIHAELGGGQVKHQQFCTENPCRMGGVNVRPPIPHGFGRFPAVLVKFDSNPGLARFDSKFFNSARIWGAVPCQVHVGSPPKISRFFQNPN